VQQQVDAVRERMASACERAGRDPGAVTLVAVTKYADLDAVARLVAAGVADLGENQAQQLRDRAPSFPGVRWHAIGPLQTNKVRYVARHAHAFHALDRREVAEALSGRRLSEGLTPLPCYVQVNLAGESTKYGVEPHEVGSLLVAAGELPGISVVGLMAMPPLAADPDESRPWFRQLAGLARDHGLAGLSMGTSADFEVAIEEGATVVRVGSSLL
jgi:pyridoxal phosphate enzyme (YggS family)